MKPLPAGKTTYKQIEDAYEAAKNGGAASEEAASKLKDAATKRVDAAKAQQSASSTSSHGNEERIRFWGRRFFKVHDGC